MLAFQNPSNGYVEEVRNPALFTLLFGCIYFAAKGIWTHAIVALVLAVVTFGLSWVIYPLYARKIVTAYYLRKGWIQLGDADMAGRGNALLLADGPPPARWRVSRGAAAVIVLAVITALAVYRSPTPAPAPASTKTAARTASAGSPTMTASVAAAAVEPSQPARTDAQNDRTQMTIAACMLAQDAVKARLKAPSTAEFPSCAWSLSDYEVRQTADRKTVYVQSYVDAQNAFGAKLRNKFIVKFKNDPTREPLRGLVATVVTLN